MASSASGQDEPNRVLWLATRAGKMEPSCPLGTTHCIPQAKFHQKPYNKSFIDQVCSVKMAGYWPCSFFANLWTSTSSRSINVQKKNLANIQPSWPHTWSITHTYRTTKCPTEAEEIGFAKTHDELIIDFGGQKRNQIQQYITANIWEKQQKLKAKNSWKN